MACNQPKDEQYLGECLQERHLIAASRNVYGVLDGIGLAATAPIALPN
jgi:hypothetical protein